MTGHLSRRAVVAGGVSTLIAAPAGASGRLRTVELFTSQGCSSCPPADRELTRLAARPDVLALSFHVDYWDYIGWKDPFARAEFTARQRAYARALAQRSIYTPEMVVDGVAHDPGQSAGRVASLFDAAAKARRGPSVDVRASVDGDDWRIAAAATPLDRAADVWLAIYDLRHTTEVKRGENRGATLTNANVVRSLRRLGGWDGTAASWRAPVRDAAAGQEAAVLVQRIDGGEVLGAVRLRSARS